MVTEIDTEAINLDTVDFLLSAEGQAMAAEWSRADLSTANTLPLLQTLRRQVAPAQAGALLSLLRLRQRGAEKFPHAEHMYFTPEALEQATAWDVAWHRAAWFARHLPPGPVLDLGCGIGGDTLALAHHRPVIAYERDEVRLRLAQANLQAWGLADRVEFRHADWTQELRAGRLPAAAGAFADPARRTNGRRIFSLHHMEPPLAILLALQEQVPALGAKVMPGVADEELPAHCGVEFISHQGTCKEAVLWFGPLALAGRWASVHVHGCWHRVIASGETPPLGPLEAGMYLHEPDPALIRAGAFAELCQQLEAHLFDPQIAYLVAPALKWSPLVQSFRILEVAPFHLKRLNRRLHELGMARVELKKRGAPFVPEAFRPRLKLPRQGRDGVVIFTRRGDERLMLIAERVQPPASSAAAPTDSPAGA